MSRTRAAVSAGLTLALMAAGVSRAPAATHHEPTLDTEPVVNGATPAHTLAVPYYGDAGAEVSVAVGQRVRAGQELADTADALVQQARNAAQANLDAAARALADAAVGPPPEQVKLDRAVVWRAQVNYKRASLALRQAKAHSAFDDPDTAFVLDVATHKVHENLHDRSRQSVTTENSERARNRMVQPAPPAAATVNVTHRDIHNETELRLRTRSAIASAQLDWAQAVHNRGLTHLNDLQNIARLRVEAQQALADVAVATAQRDLNERGALSAAKKSMHRAKKQARIAQSLAEMSVVRAPVDGTVVSVVNGRTDASAAQALLANGLTADRDGNAPVGWIVLSPSVRIRPGADPGLITVPSSALIPAGGGTVVAVQRGATVLKVPVTVAEAGAEVSKVRSDFLSPADLVITPDQTRRRAGRRTRRG